MKLPKTPLQDENFYHMILNPPKVGVVRIYMAPRAIHSLTGDMKAHIFQGAATLVTTKSQINIDGARWHLLSKIFGDSIGMKNRMEREIEIQESLDNSLKYRSFSWQTIRQAKKIYQAAGYEGDTALTIPPFLINASRGNENIWEILDDGPFIVNWQGLSITEKAQPIPKLQDSKDWIIHTDLVGMKTSPTPPFPGAKLGASANGNASREKSWWKEVDDGLFSYGLLTTM